MQSDGSAIAGDMAKNHADFRFATIHGYHGARRGPRMTREHPPSSA